MFWSDLGPQVGFEAIGLVDPKLETVGIWAKATPKARVPVAIDETPSSDASTTAAAAAAPAVVAAADDGTCPAPVDDATATAVAVVEAAAEASVETQFDDGYGKGVVFYMRDRAVVGLVMWNVHNKIPIARKVVFPLCSFLFKQIFMVYLLFLLFGCTDYP